jgi:hypothetical protein
LIYINMPFAIPPGKGHIDIYQTAIANLAF